ncbi:hypothetical protein [Nisaea sediminum]|jgi:hypothetical protein|uniref:hypothetical protein n=1 Tax=Nisaea sediminum TaxID=2775867 RepID=UPI0018689B19|nr:hypothetical protein [Nisaea sediminum]
MNQSAAIERLIEAAEATLEAAGSAGSAMSGNAEALRAAVASARKAVITEVGVYAVSWRWKSGSIYGPHTALLTEQQAEALDCWLRHHSGMLQIAGYHVGLIADHPSLLDFKELCRVWDTFYVGDDQMGRERYLGELLRSGTYLAAPTNSANKNQPETV